MSKIYVEMIDHTGDAGFRVRAGSLPLLLTTCACQMVRLICPEGAIRLSVARPVVASGHDLVELMVNWLTEINSLMAVQHELYGVFHIHHLEIDDDPPCRVTGRAEGEPLDSTRHHLAHEIKAVTFHEAFVREEADGWRCQVIFDL